MDDQDWFEKDLDDFADPQNFDEQESSHAKSSLKSKSIQRINYHSDGNEYPYDFWYLISMYISPEDIGRFALICRKTYQIVNNTSFWISIYRRYNQSEAKKLNYLLKREHFSIVRTYVIRTLHKNYSFFQKHVNQTSAIQQDPHSLISSRCIRLWYSTISLGQRQLYNYYFEFSFDNNEQIETIRSLSPIFQNSNQYLSHKDSRILHIVSPNSVPMGSYMGTILSQISLHMSSDYRYYKLKMTFHSSKYSKDNQYAVILDPILCLKIYKWYNIPANLD